MRIQTETACFRSTRCFWKMFFFLCLPLVIENADAQTVTAQVSGSTNLCSGSSANIEVALTGTPPWNLVWSDGVMQTGVTVSPSARVVNPQVITWYRLQSVTDGLGVAGSVSGGAFVRVLQTPTIISQPASAHVCIAKSVTFSVIANGSASTASSTESATTNTAGETAGCPSCVEDETSSKIPGVTVGRDYVVHTVGKSLSEATNGITAQFGPVTVLTNGASAKAPHVAGGKRKSPDTILVKPKKGMAVGRLDGTHRNNGVKVRRTFPRMGNLQTLKLPPGLKVEEAIKRYEASGLVEYAEPDYEVEVVLAPNDPRFPELWALNNTGADGGLPDADIDAPEAWSTRTSADPIIVAVIDTGVWYTHPDLAANMWVNPCPGCPVDGVVYTNDIHGINAITGSGNPLDDNFHGTHVAGTIGAVGDNGIGIAGVAWNVRIMACKFLDANGTGRSSDAIECINYAVAKGAKVLNNSWGGGAHSVALEDAIAAAREAGVIFVAAAGNARANNDVSDFFPANYGTDLDNVVAVAATTSNDSLASFSNYGASRVALGAPGAGILSTMPGTNYAVLSGTSMASPHVAGAMALIWAQSPDDSYAQIIQRILNGTDPIPSLNGKTRTAGRLNLNSSTLPQPPQDPGSPRSPWLSYQWRRNGVDIPGQTDASYTLSSFRETNDGDNIQVVVSNLCGTVISAPAFVSLATPPQILAHPLNVTQCVTNPVSFSVSASSVSPISYTWKKQAAWKNKWQLNKSGVGMAYVGSSASNGHGSGDHHIDLSGKAFGLSANGEGEVEMTRLLERPMLAGDVFAFEMDNGYVGANGAAGFALRNATNGKWFEMFFSNNICYLAWDDAPAFAFRPLPNGALIYLDMLPDKNLVVVINPHGGGTGALVDLTFPNLAIPDRIVFFNKKAGPAPVNDIFFNSFLSARNYTDTEGVRHDDATAAPYLDGWHNDDNGGVIHIPGATNNTYVIESCVSANSGSYDVLIKSGCYSLNSSLAQLTVVPSPCAGAPMFVTQPIDRTNSVGTTATFSASVLGYSLVYQWNRNGAPLSDGANVSGATSATLTLSNVTQSDVADYTLTVTNLAGAATSFIAKLTVIPAAPAVILSQPSSRTNNAGYPATFSVAATAYGIPLSYQWQKAGVDLINGGNVSGATTASLTLARVMGGDAGNYNVVISNTVGMTISSNANLKVIDPFILIPAEIRTDSGIPRSSFFPGETVFFTVTATGTSLRYQWRKGETNLVDGETISGTTTPILSLSEITFGDAGVYTVTIVSDFGSVTSFATLTVAFDSDTDRPSISISSPANNSHTLQHFVTIYGTAKDTGAGTIVGVKYRLWPETNFVLATINKLPTVTDWVGRTLILTPGTNVVHAYSIDGGGNTSVIKTNLFFYDKTNDLTLKIFGDGQVKSATALVTNNQTIPLLVGRPYLLTAFLGMGTNYVFTNWTGGTSVDNLVPVSTNLAYTFLMQSNWILQANFITNPFTAVAGVYNGLFFEANGITHGSAGFFTLKVSEKASYSGKILLDGDAVSMSGKFDLSGRTTQVVSRASRGKVDLSLALELDWVTKKITGTLGNGSWVAEMEGDRANYSLLNPETNFQGSYTFLVPRTNTHPAGGVGYGLVTNNLLGQITLAGGLADGSKLAQKVSVSQDGQWPLFAQLYKSTNWVTNTLSQIVTLNKANYRGSLLGWVTFTNQMPVGTLSWIKDGDAATNYLFPNGFTSAVQVVGSSYMMPGPGTRMINITNGTITFSEGNLSGPIAWDISWGTNNGITVVSPGLLKPTFVLTPKTGLIRGTFPHPKMNNAKSNYYGAVLQNQTNTVGYFLGTNETGSFKLIGN